MFLYLFPFFPISYLSTIGPPHIQDIHNILRYVLYNIVPF